ncbi:hypothetical protein B0H14DRAFT_3434122 [Mycena olivaceomarginata]|nr:hypothetical protein B0H14DRAFT_3434122 [Mycena olivaceomarginata]
MPIPFRIYSPAQAEEYEEFLALINTAISNIPETPSPPQRIWNNDQQQKCPPRIVRLPARASPGDVSTQSRPPTGAKLTLAPVHQTRNPRTP